MRREKSDGFTVLKSHRKMEEPSMRIGKRSTANKQTGQLDLLGEPAASLTDSSVRTDAEGARRSRISHPPVPLSTSAKSELLSVMTMESVTNEVNLRQAFAQVAANKGAPGVDRVSIGEVKQHLDQVLMHLRSTLLDGTYRPGLIRRVFIPKSGGGQRGLGIPNVVDRIVQQAVQQVLSPHFEARFHEGSHGFRAGRSCHTAIARAREFMLAGAEYVVDLDLEQFFDRVNHDRLMARLAGLIDDKRVLKLIRHLLTAGVAMPNGVVVTTTEGTPQGGPLSPLLSNIVLDELDWELGRRGLNFVRYADDCNIYVSSERAAHRVMSSVVAFIESRLRLKVNASKSAVAKPEDRHFLGFRLRHGVSGDVEVLLSERSVKRLAAKIVELIPRNWGQSLDACIKRLNGYLQGWLGFFGVVNKAEERILQASDAHIRRRLRALQLRQWGRKSHIVRHLIRRKVRASTARRVVYGNKRSVWRLSHAAAIERALSNHAFYERGLFSLHDAWKMRKPSVIAQSPQFRLGFA
jgi:RNA-directed DNA polymerase